MVPTQNVSWSGQTIVQGTVHPKSWLGGRSSFSKLSHGCWQKALFSCHWAFLWGDHDLEAGFQQTEWSWGELGKREQTFLTYIFESHTFTSMYYIHSKQIAKSSPHNRRNVRAWIPGRGITRGPLWGEWLPQSPTCLLNVSKTLCLLELLFFLLTSSRILIDNL